MIPREEIHTFRFATEIEQKAHFTEITRRHPGCGDPSAGSAQCSLPDIRWSQGGLQLAAYSAPATTGDCETWLQNIQTAVAPDTAPGETMPSWNAKIMQGARGNCPSIGRKNGRIDTHALASLLKDIRDIQPGCHRARIQIPPPQVLWPEALVVLTTARYHSAFVHPFWSMGTEDIEKPNCKNGVRPGQDEDVASQRKKKKRKFNRLSVMGQIED